MVCYSRCILANLFIITECSKRLRVEAEGDENLTHSRWSGGMGYLRRGKWIRDEKFVCMCL